MRALADQFEHDGYVVVRNLLTADEVSEYKRKLREVSGLSDRDFDARKARLGGFFVPDGVTKRQEFWELIFHPRLVATIREILGPTARYTQHSDLHVHHGAVGWHRDSANRQFGIGPDWDESREKYLVARVAIYLQSYSESRSALGVIPGSHRQESALTRWELRIWAHIKRITNRPDLLPRLVTVRPTWVATEPGDCMIFNQRILHSGTHIKGPKYAMFLSYGVENEHARNHRRYYVHGRRELGYEDYPAELARRLEEENLHLAL